MEIYEQLKQLFTVSLQLLVHPVTLVLIIIIAIKYIKKRIRRIKRNEEIKKQNEEYINGAYYQITKLPYSDVEDDMGRYGEYLIYKHLKNHETNGAKFLFNIYIPKGNDETTEIDVLMICSKGIFVFESKNYSGWIFGSEEQKNWYQTLHKGMGEINKEHFYNPIMQNRSHIKYLKKLLGEQFPMHSIIAFSDRCTLKSVQIKSPDINVVKRESVSTVVSVICSQVETDLLSESDIADIYNKLYPYTQVDIITKEQHIANIQRDLNSQPIQQIPQPIITATQTETIQMPTAKQSQTENITQAEGEVLETKTDGELISTVEQKTQNITETSNLKCPKCSGNLVLRKATRGVNVGNQFYGCSNYPKCRYIQDISESE